VFCVNLKKTAIISLYSINWLVFITETEYVYCAVRTESLYISQVMCFVWIWEQTAIFSLYSISWLVFITAAECVYCAVRTVSLLYRVLHLKTTQIKQPLSFFLLLHTHNHQLPIAMSYLISKVLPLLFTLSLHSIFRLQSEIQSFKSGLPINDNFNHHCVWWLSFRISIPRTRNISVCFRRLWN
jgi:hypothetical protein